MSDPLTNVSPIDGRYYDSLSFLSDYFSEYALIKSRVRIEIQYFILLLEKVLERKITKKENSFLQTIISSCSIEECLKIKKIEEKTIHDVKAVEYYLKEKLEKSSLKGYSRYLHFGLTSEDVNNLAYAISLNEFNISHFLPLLELLISEIKKITLEYKDSIMVARTHGQPAVPTTFGKEMAVFYHRLARITKKIKLFQFEGKLNGAVGNYNGLNLIFPNVDWLSVSRKFIASLGLTANLVTTQILPADNFVEYIQHIALVNSILLGLCQDIWSYIAFELVIVKREKNQVGSSTMPQKINPINFENAEGNLLIANNYIELYSRKLPVSRFQRDLSDSTVKRTIGTMLGHCIIAYQNMNKGLDKISFNESAAKKYLDDHGEVIAEGIQLWLKHQGEDDGYEKIRKEFQGKGISLKQITEILKKYNVDFSKVSPYTYSGLAEKIAKLATS